MSNKEMKDFLFSFDPKLKKQMNKSVTLACINEILGFISYFYAAYVAYSFFTNNTNYTMLISLGVLTAIVIVIQKILSQKSMYLSHDASFKILKSIRIGLSKKVEKVAINKITSKSIGLYKALIVDNVASLEDYVAHVMPELPSRLMHPILSTIFLFIINWKLGFSAFIGLPFVILGFLIMLYDRKNKMDKWLEAVNDLNSRTVEYVNGIEVIKVFGQGNSSYEKFTNAINHFFKYTLAWWKQSWLGTAIIMAFLSSPLLGTLPTGLYLYSTGEIGIFKLVLALILPLSILSSIFQIVMSSEVISLAQTVIVDMIDFLNEEEVVREGEEVELDKNLNFVFENVDFGYEKEKMVVNNLSFEIPNQKFTAIVGESGSGKSTIAKLMAGFVENQNGSIYFGGKNIKEIPNSSLMKNISYVSQDVFLFNGSIKENMLIAKTNASDEEIYEALRLANCMDFAKDININAKGLSGGQKQRLTIARAMLNPKDTIILDEATAYADPENEAIIQEALSNLIKGKTLIVIAHRLNTIVNADNILVVDKGSVIDSGTHKSLLENSEKYRILWKNYMGDDNYELL